MKVTRFLALSAVLCLSVVMFGQEKTSDKPASKPATSSKSKAKPQGMPMPVTDPEMAKLSKMLVGTWTVAEKAPPSQMMPEGGTGSGISVFRRGPGGNSLLQSYDSHSAMGKFSGHGVVWFDPQAKGFKNMWCDSMTPGGCAMFNGTGTWQGDKLVFSGTQDMMGKTEQVTETISDVAPNSFTFTIESGPDTNSMKNFMTIKYTRKAGGMGAMHGKQAEEPAATKQ